MDGNVWAESKVNVGSTFHFTAWLKKGAIAPFSPGAVSENRRHQAHCDLPPHLPHASALYVLQLQDLNRYLRSLYYGTYRLGRTFQIYALNGLLIFQCRLWIT